jgi:hypothetical protein
MPGCIQDDLSVCGLRVMFRYAARNASQDINRFASEVKQVSLFVFDAETNLFLNEQSATADQMIDSCMLSLNMFPGEYHFIAWGNVAEDYEFEPFVQGQTTLGEAVITLRSQGNGLVEEYPDDLYFGSQTYTVLPDLQINQLITMPMINNAKRIHVTARGLYDDSAILRENVENPFHAVITSKNGRYRFDNNYPTGEHYTYVPQERISTTEDGETALFSDFVVLREMNEEAVTDSHLRIVHRATTKAGEVEEEFLDVSLTSLLRIVASAAGTDIENKDEFDITVVVERTNGKVDVILNDWQRVDVPTGGWYGGGILY